MNINPTLLLMLFGLISFFFIAISVFRLKKHVHADGVALMFYSLIAMIVFAVGSQVLDVFAEERVWLEVALIAIDAVLITTFAYGFYRLTNWLVRHFKDNVNVQ